MSKGDIANKRGFWGTVTAKGAVAGSIALIAVLSVILILLTLMFIEIPETNSDYFLMVLGALIAWGTNGVHFFLGSSEGSKSKTSAMAAELAQDNE